MVVDAVKTKDEVIKATACPAWPAKLRTIPNAD